MSMWRLEINLQSPGAFPQVPATFLFLRQSLSLAWAGWAAIAPFPVLGLQVHATMSDILYWFCELNSGL